MFLKLFEVPQDFLIVSVGFSLQVGGVIEFLVQVLVLVFSFSKVEFGVRDSVLEVCPLVLGLALKLLLFLAYIFEVVVEGVVGAKWVAHPGIACIQRLLHLLFAEVGFLLLLVECSLGVVEFIGDLADFAQQVYVFIRQAVILNFESWNGFIVVCWNSVLIVQQVLIFRIGEGILDIAFVEFGLEVLQFCM